MNIILIGFMGVGKTSVGKSLAEKLKLEFVDIDFEIEKLENKSINEIFNDFGEDYFRKIESEILQNYIKKENCIISTGGGIILKNKEKLKNLKNVIFLDASIETIKNNLINEENKRPLLKETIVNGKIIDSIFYHKVKSILNDRYKSYLECSDFIIKVDKKGICDISEEIREKLNV